MPHPTHRRATLVTLTSLGDHTMREMSVQRQQLAADLVAGLRRGRAARAGVGTRPARQALRGATGVRRRPRRGNREHHGQHERMLRPRPSHDGRRSAGLRTSDVIDYITTTLQACEECEPLIPPSAGARGRHRKRTVYRRSDGQDPPRRQSRRSATLTGTRSACADSGPGLWFTPASA